MTWNPSQHPRAPAGSAGGGQFMAYDSKSDKGTGYGKKGGDSKVKQLQTALNKLGLTDMKDRKLAVDGMLGPLTTSSVKAAQKKLGVKVDGKVTPSLLSRLEALAKSGRKLGGPSKASQTADARIRQMAKAKARKGKASAAKKTKSTAKAAPAAAKPKPARASAAAVAAARRATQPVTGTTRRG